MYINKYTRARTHTHTHVYTRIYVLWGGLRAVAVKEVLRAYLYLFVAGTNTKLYTERRVVRGILLCCGASVHRDLAGRDKNLRVLGIAAGDTTANKRPALVSMLQQKRTRGRDRGGVVDFLSVHIYSV
jgi:hypothetical protein